MANVHDSIRTALASWDPNADGRVAEADALRLEFVKHFPLDAWPEMPVESYALGQEVEGGSVCWWMEYNTHLIANIGGGSAFKHLIYKSKDGEWRYPKEYPSLDEAWKAVRSGFVDMFQMAADGAFGELAGSTLVPAPTLRAKLLYVYFPDHFMPVCAKKHVDHFLTELGQPATSWSNVEANRQLLAALRDIPDLDGFSNQQLMYFLYHWSGPRKAVRVVKIAPGEKGRFWNDCLQEGFICAAWDEVGDLSEFETKEEFREAFGEVHPYNGSKSQVSRKSNELWTLIDLEPGDKVIANRGVSEVLAIGTVNEDGYRWRPERSEYRHTRGIDWDTSFAQTIEPVRAWATTTVSKVPASLYRKVTGSASSKTSVQADGIYLDVEQAAQRRGQVILYGPPGTGKTYAARRAAVWLLEGGSAEAEATLLLDDDEQMAVREQQLSSGPSHHRQVWFMVANPAHWPWSKLFVDGQESFALGRLKRNYPRVRAGDLVVGYESSPTKAIVALARVTTEFDADAPPEQAIALEPVAQITNGVTYEELQGDPVLAESEPARFNCQGTLFALSKVEADRLLGLLVERNPDLAPFAEPGVQRLTRVTFHPSYTYEDFIEGFRPTQTGSGGGLELVLTDGIFKQVCAAATADPDHGYVLLIDEINRGNVPKIFGELITLLEKDKRGLTIRLPQSGDEFAVPRNLSIIATMNTADRSIHLLDTALRRRFAFVELLPDSQPLEGATVGPLSLPLFLEGLNERVRERVGREKQVGHAIFYEDGAVIDTPEAFAAVFRHELLPLLQEYLYEDYRALADLLGGVIDESTQRWSSDVDDPETLCAHLADRFDAQATSA